jgi:hypothetical protein
MQYLLPERTSAFSYIQIRTESRLLIQAACKYCGESRLVSVHDGSLQLWEYGHACNTSVNRQLRVRRAA